MRPYFERDGITIYRGDALAVLPALATERVDLLLTDPPYGLGKHGRGGRRARPSPAGKMHSGGPPPRQRPPVVGDDAPFDPSPWLAFPRVILWGGNHYADRLPPSPSWLVWDKREGMTSDNSADCEMAWTNLGGPARLYHHVWRGMVIRGEENGQARLHPAQKPVALMFWCLERASLPVGALVIDPYMGSGTVAVACSRAGYRYIGVEIEERYCEIAARRLDQMVLPLGAAI